jgi:hypothetical protein
MDINLAALPNDVETLQKLVRSLATERANLSEAKAEIERLHLIIKQLQRSQFGRRNERLDDGQLQLGFEDLNVDLARTEARLPPVKAGTSKAQDQRPSLPAHLPREDVRRNKGRLVSSSSRLICWLTVDCVRLRRSAARWKPPQSATVTKARNNSKSSMRLILFFDQSYYKIPFL